METNTPTMSRLKIDEQSEQELGFLKVLDSRMVGQKSAKAAAARAKRRAGNPLRNQRGPVYKALLIGKSRTGKTLTAETTALSLHGDASALVRIDCAEYQHGHEVSRLLGAPPSYVGFDAPDSPDEGDKSDKKPAKAGKAPTALMARQNLLASRKGSKTPITIILLDEIEKAHTSLKDVLLAIFDKGKIRLANNSETDFTDCIFFLTSNLGMDQLEKFGQSIGFRTQEVGEPTEKDVAEVVTKELKRHFRPEFHKRLDETVIFAPLTQNQLSELVQMELGFVQGRINQSLPSAKRFIIDFDPNVGQHILDLTAKTEGGVAEVKQIIEREVIDVLGGELEKNSIKGGDVIKVSVETSEPSENGVKTSPKLAFYLSQEAPAPTAGDTTSSAPGSGAVSTGTAVVVARAVPDDLKQLRDLIANKVLTTTKDRQTQQRTISLGPELGALAKKLGGQSSTELDIVQRAFVTDEAQQLLWSKVSNAYWFWKIYGEAAKAARSLPIDASDVQVAIDALRDEVGVRKVAPKYSPETDKPVNVMRYMQAGILLLEKVESGNDAEFKIRINALFV